MKYFSLILFVYIQWSLLKLSVSDVIVSQKKVPMETESKNSLGGTIILLALFAQRCVLLINFTYPVSRGLETGLEAAKAPHLIKLRRH